MANWPGGLARGQIVERSRVVTVTLVVREGSASRVRTEEAVVAPRRVAEPVSVESSLALGFRFELRVTGRASPAATDKWLRQQRRRGS